MKHKITPAATALYSRLVKNRPEATIVSIGHRNNLYQFHHRILTIHAQHIGIHDMAQEMPIQKPLITNPDS